jgi:hypothetical protein
MIPQDRLGKLLVELDRVPEPAGIHIGDLSIFFFLHFPKILIPKDLRARGSRNPGKILSRKDLYVKYSGIRT